MLYKCKRLREIKSVYKESIMEHNQSFMQETRKCVYMASYSELAFNNRYVFGFGYLFFIAFLSVYICLSSLIIIMKL